MSDNKLKTPCGLCPWCKSPGKSRDRRPDGDDTCVNGHKYPSRNALAETKQASPQGDSVLDDVKYHGTGIMKDGKRIDPSDFYQPQGDGTWQSSLDISNLPLVNEAISNFAHDTTEDNAVCMIEAVRAALTAPTQGDGETGE